MASDQSAYGLSKQVSSAKTAARDLPYLPRLPRQYRPRIGLIGAGGVTEYHLRAYSKLGLEVLVICDVDLERARKRRDQFFPAATVCSDYREVIRRKDIDVVDAALHPQHRLPVVESALLAGKHVLSQKPFAENLDAAVRLANLADERGLKLAVNQNGRWAPHFSYALAAARGGLLGEIGSVDFNLSFDHSWTIGTPFENIHHLLLYDFGVHWFDLACCFFKGRRAKAVYASVSRTSYQKARPPFLASAVIDFEGGQARLALNGAVQFGQVDRTLIAGSLGTLEASGPSLNDQTIRLANVEGNAVPELVGTWFENGFQGTMCELLCAIEEDRSPQNSARDNIETLAACFAALSSANSGDVVLPGSVRELPAESVSKCL